MWKTINFFIATVALSDLIFTVISVPRVGTILLFGYKWLVHFAVGLDILPYDTFRDGNNNDCFPAYYRRDQFGPFLGRAVSTVNFYHKKNLLALHLCDVAHSSR